MFNRDEFSRLTQVTIKQLEAYEKSGLIIPDRGNRVQERVYGAWQLERLCRVIELQKQGMEMPQIKELLLNEIRTVHELRRQSMNSKFNISIKSVESYFVFSLRKVVDHYGYEEELWLELYEEIQRRGLCITSHNRGMTIYHDASFRTKEVDLEVSVKIKTPTFSEGNFLYRETRALDKVLSAVACGPHENLAEVQREMAKWLIHHPKYQIMGYDRRIFYKGPCNEESPEQYITEVQIPLQLRKHGEKEG